MNIGDKMIERIEILITRATIIDLKVTVDYNTKECIINDEAYSVTDDFLEELKDLLYGWNNEYGNSNQIDREEFFINVISKKDTTTYHGKGNYPINYPRLREILGEVYGK